MCSRFLSTSLVMSFDLGVVPREMPRHTCAREVARTRARCVQECAARSPGTIDDGLGQLLHGVRILRARVAPIVDEPPHPRRMPTVLHQARRERDGLGRIVATIDDYAAVRELLADLVACGVEASVPITVREAVTAVRRLNEGTHGGVTVTAVAASIGIDKSAASRRVRAVLERGYLRNLEDRRGRPLCLVPGDPLPGDVEISPRPDSLLNGCAVAPLPAGQDDPPPPRPVSGPRGSTQGLGIWRGQSLARRGSPDPIQH